MIENESKERQPIWGVRKKHEFWFYTALLIFGGWNIARLEWKDWDSFVLAAGERIFASVLIVWFAYQAFDWGVSAIMSAGDFFRRQIERRKEKDRKREEELRENGRKEGRDSLLKLIESDFRKQGIPEEQIQRFLEQTKALGNWEKNRKD